MGVRFNFVSHVSFFVFTNITEFVPTIFCFFRSPVFRTAGTIAFFLSVRSLPTTMCPQNDHNYRLPYPTGFVK